MLKDCWWWGHWYNHFVKLSRTSLNLDVPLSDEHTGDVKANGKVRTPPNSLLHKK